MKLIDDRSAGALLGLAVILLILGLVVMNPSARFYSLALSAILSSFSVGAGSRARRLWSLVVLSAAILFGIPTYIEHRKAMDTYLKHPIERFKPSATPQ